MSATAAALALATVFAVTDGDTVRVRYPDGRTAIVRLLGIDTPETKHPRLPVQCYGPEATLATKRLLLGKRVKLEADPTQQNQDRFGRQLRYIWSGRTLINEQLLREGFAREYTYRVSYKYRSRFIAAQMQARETGQGLWTKCKRN